MSIEDISMNDKEAFSNNYKGLSRTIKLYAKMITQVMPGDVLSDAEKNIRKAIRQFTNILTTDYMKSFYESVDTFNTAGENAKSNPNSFYNYYEYQKRLDTYHWAWPYQITAEELKDLLEKATNEEQFDKLMVSFFNKQKMENILCDIECQLPRKQKTIFKQIENSYKNRDYAIINLALCSIIDNLLSVLLKNKGCTKRIGILTPILKYYSENYSLSEVSFLFELHMLANNLDMIFGNYDFSQKIIIDSNKKARRHLASHGVMYSNRKSDSIMLLNTLEALLDMTVYLLPFSGTLQNGNNKAFTITAKPWVVKNRINKTIVSNEP